MQRTVRKNKKTQIMSGVSSSFNSETGSSTARIPSPNAANHGDDGNMHGKFPVRLAGGWWLVLVYSERRVLLAVSSWLLVAGLF
jgi:hypothetical protein